MYGGPPQGSVEHGAQQRPAREEQRIEERLPGEVRRLHPRQERQHTHGRVPREQLPHEREAHCESHGHPHGERHTARPQPARDRTGEHHGTGLPGPQQDAHQQRRDPWKAREVLHETDDPVEHQGVARRACGEAHEQPVTDALLHRVERGREAQRHPEQRGEEHRAKGDLVRRRGEAQEDSGKGGEERRAEEGHLRATLRRLRPVSKPRVRSCDPCEARAAPPG